MKNTPTYIERELSKVLKKMVRQFPSVVITGPRQAGKSTLLQHLFSKTHRYMTLDDPKLRALALNDPKTFLNESGSKLIIDEIQYAPELLSYLKILIDCDRHIKGRYILTGSQQFNLMKNLGDSLAGRIAILELLPFSVEEKKLSRTLKKGFSTTREYFLDACLRGSFPELVQDAKLDREAWYGAYLSTYLERDIRNLFNIGDLRTFQQFLVLLAGRCSQILNLSALSSDLGVAVNTLKRWVSVLEASRIITLLSPYYQRMGKRISKQPKVYFHDIGLVCYLLSIRDPGFILKGVMNGALFENFCLQETIKTLWHHHKHSSIFYLRTSNDLEIDLLLERNGKLYPVEFKLSTTASAVMAKPIQRFKELFSDWTIAPGKLVCLDDESGPLTKEVSVLSFDDYLNWLKQ